MAISPTGLIDNSCHIGSILQPKFAMWSSREQTMQIIKKSAYPHIMELLQVRKDYSVCHWRVSSTRSYLLKQLKISFFQVHHVVQRHKQIVNAKKIHHNTKNLAKISRLEVVCPFRNHNGQLILHYTSLSYKRHNNCCARSPFSLLLYSVFLQ